MSNFSDIINETCKRYMKLLETISGYVVKYKLDLEKHMKHYNKNCEEFKNLNNDEIFKFFIKNYLHIMPEIVDHNIDYFLTQKPYILKRSKRGNKKKPNQKATYIINNMMIRYVFSTLKESPKDNKISENTEIKNIFGELVQIFDLFYNDEHNYLKDLAHYITEHFSNSKLYKQMCDVMINYQIIIEEEDEEEEEVSTDDEGTDSTLSTKTKKKKSSSSSSSGGGAFDFASSLLGDSSIGKLAKEISEEINPDELKGLGDVKDQNELIQKLFTPSDDGQTGFGNIMNKIIGKVGSKLKDGSINQEAMSKEAGNLMNSLGGGGAAASLFKNMFK